MARYDAPSSPFDIYTTGCLRVYYPDSPLLFRALRAQLTELESRFVWETGGDIDAAEKLEQDWLEAGLLTFAAIGQGCGDDCAECEQTIIDLTLQIQQCQELIQEYENMEITVNCNCGGGGCCGVDVPVPLDPNGDPYPLIPIDPQDPLGDDTLVWDDAGEVPPPGYPDYPTFSSDRCRAANWFFDSYVEFVKNSDIAERKLSAGAALLDVAVLLVKALPGPVGEWSGFLVILKYARILAESLATATAELEDLNDWLQLAADKVEENRQYLTCGLYQMLSVEWFKSFFLTFLAGYVDPAVADQYPSQSVEITNWLRGVLEPLADLLANKVYDGVANANIPDDYVPTIDCSLCGQLAPPGYEYVPGSWESVGAGVVKSSQVYDYNATIETDGSVTIDGTADSGARYTAMQLMAADPPDRTPLDSRYVGIAVVVTAVSNAQEAYLPAVSAPDSLQDAGFFAPFGEIQTVRGGLSNPEYPADWPTASYIQISNGCNVDSCMQADRFLYIGGRSVDAGQMVVSVSPPFWIAKLNEAC